MVKPDPRSSSRNSAEDLVSRNASSAASQICREREPYRSACAATRPSTASSADARSPTALKIARIKTARIMSHLIFSKCCHHLISSRQEITEQTQVHQSWRPKNLKRRALL